MPNVDPEAETNQALTSPGSSLGDRRDVNAEVQAELERDVDGHRTLSGARARGRSKIAALTAVQ